jgi:hypothetical protein
VGVLDLYASLYPYRVVFGVLFFVVLGTLDYAAHPDQPRRAKEYLFLLASAGIASAYGVVHDHVTATISIDYFLYGKGLIESELPFRVAVTLLAVQATYWVGLVAGAALLLANNPRPDRPQLSYRELSRLIGLPLAGAAVAAAIGGALFALLDPLGGLEVARDYSPNVGPTRFLAVWGIHMGSYVGGAIGAAAATALVVTRRRALRTAPPTPPAATPARRG